MKRIKKSCLAAAICILLTGTIAVAQTSFEEQTENWLQRSSENFTSSGEDTSGSLRDDPPGEPNWEDDVPVGDALPLLFGLSLVYMMVKYQSLKRAKN